MRFPFFSRGTPPEVVVVTRAGCHLCEEMITLVRARVGDALRTVDLDAAVAQGDLEPAQHERWTTLVPVLLVDGQEVAHHRVTAAELRGLLGPGRSRRFGGSGGPTIE